MTCIRTAWLTLAGATLLLEDETKGYFCQSLDLGSPTIRDVMSNIPDQHGADDRTLFFGPRTVSAQITALSGAGAVIDDVADNFSPYMVPTQRPVLHYILDRPGAAERTLTLRAANYDWPIVGTFQRDINLQWVAADPIARDPNVNSQVARTGSSGTGGRTYNFNHNRVYPAGGGSPSTANLSTPGDVAMRPLLRIYGPVSGPQLTVTPTSGPVQHLNFVPSYFIDAGHWVDVDCQKRTAYRDSDPSQNVINQIDWTVSIWLFVMPLPVTATMTFAGANTTNNTQVVVTWQDGYLV